MVGIQIIATVFPAICVVLGFLAITTGNLAGWLLIGLGAVTQVLYLFGRYGHNLVSY